MNVQPVVLTGQWVRLEPLEERHAADLIEAADYEEIWRYMPTPLQQPEQLHQWIKDTLELQRTGTILPFAIIELSSGKAVGSTRYLDIRPKDRGLEIGWTWLTPRVWRTSVNTECKLMLLRHAFETLDAIRVQIKTDKRNTRSRQAIERIGGQFEGILRQHIALRDGTFRDSVYYSILHTEWPQVKQNLLAKLEPAQAIAS
jgi:RimJ/RimL family protein N-acetyltransferase